MPQPSIFTDDDQSILYEAFNLALPTGRETIPTATLIATLRDLAQQQSGPDVNYLNKNQFNNLYQIVQQATTELTELTFPQLLKVVNDFLVSPAARHTSTEQYRTIFNALSNGQPMITMDSLKLAAQSTYSDRTATDVIALLTMAESTEADIQIGFAEFVAMQNNE